MTETKTLKFLFLFSKIRGSKYFNFSLNFLFLALFIIGYDYLLFPFSIMVKTVLHIEKIYIFYYLFFGISLCPYGNVFIPSERI